MNVTSDVDDRYTAFPFLLFDLVGGGVLGASSDIESFSLVRNLDVYIEISR